METLVDTLAGTVRGRIQDGVHAFLGVPYAAPPVGPALFAAPAPVSEWQGVRDATELGPTPPQAPAAPPYGELIPMPLIAGDDFLNVNVWTPQPGAARLPVMVFLPGGAFIAGGNSVPCYDGTAFARDGVVAVTINYRLGAPGFAELPDAPSNRGLLDQIAALEWVRDNIAAFGGDPDQVTVFGESAGAMSIATLMAAPAARGLFRRAIVQSGSGTFAVLPADAELITKEVAGKLGVEPAAHALAGITIDALVEAQEEVRAELGKNPDPARYGKSVVLRGTASLPFLPVIDGELITQLPVDALAAGSAAGIDVLLGTNAEEYNLFFAPLGFMSAVTPELMHMVTDRTSIPRSIVDTYRERRPDTPLGDVLSSIMTDAVFWAPTMRIAHTQAVHARTFVYEFAWRSSVEGLGACHGLELPFVFDTLAEPAVTPLTGSKPPQPLADQMHAAWVSFATSGDPGWERFDTGIGSVMRLDHPSSAVVRNPRADDYALWNNLT